MTEEKKSKKGERASSNSAGKKITIELVAFVFLAVYLVGYTVTALNKPKISIEVVSTGRIESPKEFDGIVARSESVTVANEPGNAIFSYNENEYIKKDSVVCVIRDAGATEILEKEIETINDDLLSRQAQNSHYVNEEVKRINTKIETEINEMIPYLMKNESGELYKYKFQLQKDIDARNNIILSDVYGSSADQKNAFESQLSDSEDKYYSSVGGILSYCVDGLEETYTPEKILTPMQIGADGAAYSSITGSKGVEAGEPVFKVVDSNVWYLCAYLDLESVAGWEEGQTQEIFLKNQETRRAITMQLDKLVNTGGKAYVVFSSSKYLTDFIDVRNVKFCLDDDSYEGLKIPNGAIIEKTALELPTQFLYEFRGSRGVYIKNNENLVFKPVSVLSQKGDFAYLLQDFENIKIGAVVYRKDKDEKNYDDQSYTISNIVTTKGVYVANSGTAEFRQINILTANEYFSIIEKGSQYGVKPYDNIVTDAGAITDNQIIR